ncbi:MAG: ABC transporter ATP-binding protein, partial [Solobacterium sp.]|nr:ABC transporter ATP-binding protein [Solobacterium sp.]
APRDRNIAMVFQNYSLYPHMTVYDNMAFSLKLAKLPKDEIDKKVREAAKTLEITQNLDRLPKALSGGQRQRVAIGRAIVRSPQVILMDEPLSNLDAKLRGQMRSEIIKLRQKINTTFVYVTHDQVEAMTLGDRIVVMKDGFIQQVGTPQEVFNHPVNTFVAGFIGTPQINFFHHVPMHKKDGEYYITIQGREIRLDDRYQSVLKEKNTPDKEVIVGIRPVHVEMSEEGFTGKIEVSEMMGSEVHLHVNMSGDDIVAVIPTANLDLDLVSIGKDFTFSFNPKLLHVFDTETEENLI